MGSAGVRVTSAGWRSKARKEFERLVEIMKLVGTTGARVEFDARLPDRITGQLRQVDVAVWQPTHHGEMLIAVECKDCKRRVDVQTIEQAAQKNDDIKADRVAIVSRSGFFLAARKKAEHLHVDLLTIAEIANNDWPSWMEARTITMIEDNPSLESIKITGMPNLVRQEMKSDMPIVRGKDRELGTGNQILDAWLGSGGRELIEPAIRAGQSVFRLRRILNRWAHA